MILKTILQYVLLPYQPSHMPVRSVIWSNQLIILAMQIILLINIIIIVEI